MNCQLSVPAKTFILGEYLVLRGGMAILLTSYPSFVLNVSAGKDAPSFLSEPINYESPAGNFINRHLNFYKNFSLEFFDPYKGIGGLGASSAQFALVYALKMHLKNGTDEELFHALEAYSHSAWNGEGFAPSGADIIAQLKGGLCLFHPEKQTINTMEWPFTSLDYCLIHTNNKITTHNHLKSLDKLDVSGLDNIVEEGLSSLEKKTPGYLLKVSEDIEKVWKKTISSSRNADDFASNRIPTLCFSCKRLWCPMCRYYFCFIRI